MGKQTLLWTTLPNGGNAVVGGTLRLSVVVSPRLEYTAVPPKKELSQFPEMADWPSRAKALKFTVNFSNGAKIPAEIVSEIDGDLWSQLFPPTTFVRGHVFERMDDRFIVSYPAANLAKSMKGIYQLVAATSPAGYPSADGLRTVLSPLSRILDAGKGNETSTVGRGNFNVKQRLDALKKVNSSTRSVPPSAPNLLADMNQFQIFHTPLVNTVADPQTGAPLTKPMPLPAPEDFQKRIDFHQMVSGVAKHPELMKRLGLLFDLEIKLPAAIPATGLVWISVSPNTKSGNFDLKPRTHYTTKNNFEAQPKTAVIQNGLLQMKGDEFDVLQVDVDGAAMKMLNLANTLQTTQQNQTTDTPQFLSVPSLRSGGLSVARAGRAVDLAKNFDNSQATNAQAQALLAALAVPGVDVKAAENANIIELWAEDVTRGFRIDVREVAVDASGKPVSSGASGVWRSLLRRRGEYRISSTPLSPPIAPDEGATQIAVTSPANAAPASKPDLYLQEALFRWAGWSLAAPRPGKTLAPDDTAQDISNEAPPGMKLEVNFKAEPGSLPRLRFGKAYQIRARVCDLAGNGPTFELKGNAGATDINEGFYARFEPLTSPTLLLTKQLSDAQTPGESLERIVIRSRNTSPDKDNDTSPEKSVRHIAPPKTSQEMAELHGMFDDGGLNVADYASIASKDGDFEGDERSGRMAPDAPLELPYLPDPLATKALFLGLPGSAAATFFLQSQAFDGAWPNVKPFRLRTSEEQSGWNAGDRVLDVALPKAEIYTALMYSHMPTAQIPNMGVYRWGAEALAATPAKLDFFNKVALAGVFWMTTPPRALTFVHATQQPIGVAKWVKLEPARDIGDTFAVFQGALKCHGKSTGRVDVLAEWKEPIDNLNKLAPETLQGRANAWEMPLHIGNFRIVADTKLPLADTKGLYGLYEEADTTLTFTGRTDNNVLNRGFSNLRRHDFGDTKHRLVRYTAKSTTRFREYFPEEIRKNDDNLTRLSDVKELHVPSSARPDAPKVLYVIPTFRWEKGGKSSTRNAGLRVYLDRPWYSSGDNELLGVVTVNPPQGVFGGGSAEIEMLGSKTRAVFEAVPFVAVEPKAETSVFGAMPHVFDSATKFKTDSAVATQTNALNTKTLDKSTFSATSATETSASSLSATSSTRSLVKSTNTRALTAVQSATISPGAIAAMQTEKVAPTEKFTPVIGISKTEAPFIAALGAIFSTTPPPPPPAIPEVLKPYVTQWGSDPIWASAPTRSLASPQSFPLATALGTSLSLDENGEAVAVAGHTPQYDEARGLWYCDIEMNAGLSYFPFVRLALARFQPYSIEGAHLSRVVLAEFAQLAAKRSASWTRNGNSLKIAVSGPHYKGSSDKPGVNEDAIVMSQALNIGRIEVVVERRTNGSDMAWRAVPNASFELEPDAIISQNPIKAWTGNIDLPNDSGELRLIIKEWEGYRADKPDTTSADPNWSDAWQRTERLVYADVIEL